MSKLSTPDSLMLGRQAKRFLSKNDSSAVKRIKRRSPAKKSEVHIPSSTFALVVNGTSLSFGPSNPDLLRNRDLLRFYVTPSLRVTVTRTFLSHVRWTLRTPSRLVHVIKKVFKSVTIYKLLPVTRNTYLQSRFTIVNTLGTFSP